MSWDRLIDIASTDKEIGNIEKFKTFLKVNSVPESSSKGTFNLSNHNVVPDSRPIFKLSIEEGGDIRVVDVSSVNPGMTEKAKNHPSEMLNTFEVYKRDTIPLETYEKMSRDPVLRLATNIMIGFISSLKYKLKLPDEEDAALINAVYKRFHSETIRSLLKYGLRNGFSFAEKVYVRRTFSWMSADGSVSSREAIGYEKIKWLNPRQGFKYYKERKSENLKYIEQNQGVKGYVKIPRRKLVWFAMDKEYGGIFGTSRYKSAFSYWYFSKIDEQHLMKHLQRVGSPHLEIRYPTGISTVDGETEPVQNETIAAHMGKSVVSNGTSIMPSDKDTTSSSSNSDYLWSAEWKEARNNSIQPHLDFLSFSDARKIQGIGMLPSAILSGGNFSEKDAAADFLQVMLEDVVEQIEAVIRQDILEPVVAYNLGEQLVDVLEFRIDRSGLGKVGLLKELLLQTQRLAWSSSELTPKTIIDLEGIARELGVDSVKVDDYFTVTQQTAPDGGPTPEDEARRIEDSNGQNRATPDERDRGRPTSSNNATERSD